MKKLQKIDLYLITLIFTAVASIALRTYALLTSFSQESLHFENKIAIYISSGVLVIATLVFLSYTLLGEKKINLIAKSDNAASYIPAGIVSTALLFMGVKNLAFGSDYLDGRVRIFTIVSGILAFLSVCSFFVSIFIQKNENLFKAAFSLCIVFFLATYAATLFFNREIHPTNSPNKIVDQMAYISAAMFFLFESRIYLGRALWRPYVAFGLIASAITAYSAIPSLIVYAVNGYVVSDSIIESVLTLTLALFVFSKVLQTSSLTENIECPEAQSVVMIAKMREAELEEQRKDAHARNNNKEENEEAQDASNYTFDIPYVDPANDKNDGQIQ